MFFLILIVFLLIGGMLTIVAVQNIALSVHLSFFSWQTPNFPVGMWLIAAFLLGAIVLYLASVVSAISDRRELKLLRQQVLLRDQQIAAMRLISGSPGDISTATTRPGPFAPLAGANMSQAEGRIPTSPLSPTQKFR
jgi:uncharacterized integral membrane protein